METTEPKLSTAEVCQRIQTALDNMGRALKCPVCLSTLRDKPVVLSSCVHAFCQNCLSRSFEASTKETSCPICKVPCHRRRSVSDAPFLGKLAHAYQRTLRHFGLTPVKYTSALPLLTQLGPEENDQDDVAMIHRHFQVSKTFEAAMRQDKLASRTTILQQHQSVVEANGKVLLETIVKRKHVDVKIPTVQFAANVAAYAASDDVKEPTNDKEQIHSSVSGDPFNSINGRNASNTSCLKSTPLSKETNLAMRSSASKLAVQFESLSPIPVATHESPIVLHNNDDVMSGKGSATSSNTVVANPEQHNEGIFSKADANSDSNTSVPAQESSPSKEPTIEGEPSFPMPAPKTAMKAFGYNVKSHHQTPETDKSSQSLFPASEGSSFESFTVGDIIDVKPRTWPGINKHGGTAKIVKVNDDKSYDVTYVLGGREKRVDAVFCSIHRDSLPDRKKDSIPMCLLQQLASEGFDVEGNQTGHKPKSQSTSDSKPRSVAVKKCKVKSTKRQGSSDEDVPKKRPKLEQSNKVADAQPRSLDELMVLPIPETNSLADSLYESRIDAAIKKQQVVVLASGLAEYDAAQLKELEKCSKKWEVAVKVSSSFSQKRVTLCLTPVALGSKADSAIAHRRTMKGMQCALAGIPIVSCKWIQHCLLKSKVLPPLSPMFIRALPSGTGKFDHGVALLAAFQQRSKVAHLPLQHCRIFLSGISTQKEKDTNVILRQAGANVISNVSALLKLLKTNSDVASGESREKVVLVCDDVIPRNVASNLQSLQSLKNITIVNSSWAFDSISAGRALSSIDYPPSHISAKPFWERTNFR